MTIHPAVESLLTALGPPKDMSFPKLLEALHTVGYTGPIVLHCRNGVPQQVDVGAPIRLCIVEGLDNRPKAPPD